MRANRCAAGDSLRDGGDATRSDRRARRGTRRIRRESTRSLGRLFLHGGHDGRRGEGPENVGHGAEHVGKDRKSTRLNSSHGYISYAVFCLKKKKKKNI